MATNKKRKKIRERTPSEIILDSIIQSEENVQKNININLGRSFKNINKGIESLIKEIYNHTSEIVVNTNNHFTYIDDKTKKEIEEKIKDLPIKDKINKIKNEYEKISMYNKRNLLNFLDDVVHPVIFKQIKNLRSPLISSFFKVVYYKYGLKQKPIEIKLNKEKKQEMNNLTDWRFTLNEILKKEGVFKRFKGLTLEEVRKDFDIDVEQSYVNEEIVYKKGFTIETNNNKNKKHRTGPPIIDSIDARVKISKRLSKKIFDAITGIDPIPLDIYKNLFYKFSDKKYHNHPYKINERRFNECVNKVHQYLCDVKTSKKKGSILVNGRIPQYIDDMLGTNRKEDYVHEGIGSIVKGHKVYGVSKAILGKDMYGIRIVFKDEDSIDKFLGEIGSYFNQDFTKFFTHNKKRKNNRTGDGFVDIKDYRTNTKGNGYRGVHPKIEYINTMIELQLRTKEDDEVAEKGDADHKEYKFFQRLRREVRFYKNPIDQGLFYAINYLFKGLR